MDRKPVKSSNIVSIGYDPEKQTMEVEYKNGGVYSYASVPQGSYDELMAASSVGSHLHAHIKPRHKHSRNRPDNEQ